ncbi:MAG: hypoxanthine phosphoribosyltransferase [Verrucomicrobiota bacterium]
MISRARLARRVNALARQIEKDFAGRDLVIVALLNGTVMFLADLLRGLSLPLRLDFIGVSSYREGAGPGGLIFTKELRLDVRGRDVLLLDDILDTGQTLARVLAKLRPLQPRRIKICVLLDKPGRRVENIAADYTGFTIPDEFVVGYGLDYGEKYRNLPFIGLLHPKMVRTVTG